MWRGAHLRLHPERRHSNVGRRRGTHDKQVGRFRALGQRHPIRDLVLARIRLYIALRICHTATEGGRSSWKDWRHGEMRTSFHT